MSDLGTAIIIILSLGTGLALVVWLVSTRFPAVTRIVTRSFWCPIQGRNVTAEFQEAAWDGRLVEVNRCSAFSPWQAVACEKVCLRLKKLPSVRGGGPRVSSETARRGQICSHPAQVGKRLTATAEPEPRKPALFELHLDLSPREATPEAPAPYRAPTNR